MKKILGKLKKKKVWIPLLIVLAAVLYWMFSGGSSVGAEIDVMSAERQTVSRKVSETGLVKPQKELSLAFTRGGRVDLLPAKEGQVVKAGTLLASIDAKSEKAAFQAARANLLDAKNRVSPEDKKAAEASVEAAQIALENTESQADLAVENALETFLNTDLTAYLKDGNVGGSETDVAPTITGTYTSTERGKYVLELYSSSAQSGSSLRYSFINEDGEKVEEGLATVTTHEPEPLGDRGLYLEFPENFANGYDTTWVIPIPNERSAQYVNAKNAYQQALETKENKIAAQKAALKSAKASKARTLQSTSDHKLDALQANVESARVALGNTTLTAPMAGVVAEVALDKGEIARAGTPVVTLLSENTFRVSVDVPEADIVGLDVGDTAEITFDAYDGLKLSAKVTFVSPQAVTTQGVTSVEVKLGFQSDDARLKAGITADVDIHTSERKDVIAVPTRAVIEMNEEKFVRVLPEGITKKMLSVENIAKKLGRIQVTTGLRGTNGLVEITSGLSGGEQVVTFLPEAMRNALEEAKENKE